MLHVNTIFFSRLEEVLNLNLNNNALHASEVAKELAISKSTLNRKLKRLGKPSIKEFIKEYRLQKATNFLSAGYKVFEASAQVGFNSPSYFTRCFKAHFNILPAKFSKSVSPRTAAITERHIY